MKITLHNDFHNTNVILSPRFAKEQDSIYAISFIISKGQFRKIKKQLCGRENCCCGLIRGKQLYYETYHMSYNPNMIYLSGKWYKYVSLDEVHPGKFLLRYEEVTI